MNTSVIELNPQKWNKDRYCTPQPIMDRVYEYFTETADAGDQLSKFSAIELDPCWDPNSVVNARRRFDFRNGEDGIMLDWQGYDRIWCNPPYSESGIWVRKALTYCHIDQYGTRQILLLLPGTPACQWYQDLMHSNNCLAYCQIGPKRLGFLKNGIADRNPRGENTIVLLAGIDKTAGTRDEAILCAHDRALVFKHTFDSLGHVATSELSWYPDEEPQLSWAF